MDSERILLTYPDLLEYLADRSGEPTILSVYAAIGSVTGADHEWPLIRMHVLLGPLQALADHFAQTFLDGQAGAWIPLACEDAEEIEADSYDRGILLTLERFATASLDAGRADLWIEAGGAQLSLDFDGSAPDEGRWSDAEWEDSQ